MGYRWEVDGFRARTLEEYEAALRDKSKIDKIKLKTNLNNRKQLEAVYSSIINGQIRFETTLGFDFEDYIDTMFNNPHMNANDNYNVSKNQKGKNNKAYATKEKNKKNTSEDVKNKKKPVSINDYDEQMKEDILHHINKRNSKRRLILILSGLVALCSIGYFAFYIFYTQKNQNEMNLLASLKNSEKTSYTPTGTVHNGLANIDTTDLPNILDEYKILYSKNQSIIGWLKIADTNIDYPVMQCGDNEYYLTHNYSQEYDKNGSIFLDCNCSVYPKNTNLIIYGHHMSSGKMFGTLQKYESFDYYQKHSVISFDTIYQKGQYAVMYVFRDKIHNKDDISFKYYEFIDCNSEEEFNSYMQEMAKLSLYDTGIKASFGDSLITLSTCDYNEKNGRFVVVAKQIE